MQKNLKYACLYAIIFFNLISYVKYAGNYGLFCPFPKE